MSGRPTMPRDHDNGECVVRATGHSTHKRHTNQVMIAQREIEARQGGKQACRGGNGAELGLGKCDGTIPILCTFVGGGEVTRKATLHARLSKRTCSTLIRARPRGWRNRNSNHCDSAGTRKAIASRKKL